MQHPRREEWIPYLFGEAPENKQEQLAAHLESCEQCAAQLEEWQRTLRLLDAWKAPRSQPSFSGEGKIWRWAAAAAIVVAALGLGQWSIGEQLVRHRAEVHNSLKSMIADQVQAELIEAFQPSASSFAGADAINNSLQEIVATTVHQNAPNVLAATRAQTERLLQTFFEFCAAARHDDQQAALALYHQLQQQQTADYRSLRKDLETVASLTDEEIRQARHRIIQLSAHSEKPNAERF